jgi:hypothetical protein
MSSATEKCTNKFLHCLPKKTKKKNKREMRTVSKLALGDTPFRVEEVSAICYRPVPGAEQWKMRLYGNYITVYLQLERTGVLSKLEKQLHSGIRRRSMRMRQLVGQYSVAKSLSALRKLRVTKQFMRLVCYEIGSSVENRFEWVDIKFLSDQIEVARRSLKAVGMWNERTLFEVDCGDEEVHGRADVVCDGKVAEVKCVQWITKGHCIQALTYADLMQIDHAYLINTRTGMIWMIKH